MMSSATDPLLPSQWMLKIPETYNTKQIINYPQTTKIYIIQKIVYIHYHMSTSILLTYIMFTSIDSTVIHTLST